MHQREEALQTFAIGGADGIPLHGSSNAEIGEALGIDERTVESHLRCLFDRYGADPRTELSTYSVRAGWIDLSTD